MREAATFTLGRSGDRRAVPPLLKALGDRRGSVQTLACLGLGQIDDRASAPALIATLADARSDDATRAACAYALGARRLTAALPALLGALGDNRGEAQRLAAWALGQIGDAKALGPLIRAYFARAGRTRRRAGVGDRPDQRRRARAGAATGLGEYPQRGGKYNAAEAIAQLPGRAAARRPPQRKLVVDHAEDIAKGLLDALGRAPRRGRVGARGSRRRADTARRSARCRPRAPTRKVTAALAVDRAGDRAGRRRPS